mmetsp:Transcript_6444/g.7200  ORF Transcript_6444/g.7200 Transcript_6444/m.7200 type:complete len:355 (+) Transcript_6444:13-1077(+)|eukprot:CAMPEP_0205821768 /NCGR_PEP_ID=MMETSP0206-20130828/9485_1 /ASSEMBLY_ACC=CAM_ASM_000279 /TAXON_ID=36767 /ORGANISM="Euplotes focardii, Strain TN1" /LENGTH=354 /DNA_ID=CAMNT_0053117497 /DNA_START=13 /DNA_END=1077 /DNA_ORIENTATION=+
MKILPSSKSNLARISKVFLTKIRHGGAGYKACGIAFTSIMLYTYTRGPKIENEVIRLGLAGLVSTLACELVSQPIDTLNIKSKVKKNFGIVKFIKAKGPSSLMRGIQPVLYGISISSFVYFILYKKLKDQIKIKMDQRNIPKDSLFSVFMMSAGASTLANSAAIGFYYPYDLVKTRMQIKGKYNYKNVIDAFMKIRNEKTTKWKGRNFFKGFGLYSITFISFMTLEFSIYETLMMWLAGKENDKNESLGPISEISHNEHHDGIFEHKEDKKISHIIFASGIAGAIGGLLTNPLEYLTVNKQANPNVSVKQMMKNRSTYDIIFKGSLFRTSYYSAQAMMIFLLLEKLGAHLDCEL